MPKGAVDFRIENPYYERVIYMGRVRTGKTNLLAHHLKYAKYRYVVWDTAGSISKMIRPTYPAIQQIIDPNQWAEDEQEFKFKQLCDKIFIQGYTVLVLDEIYTFCSKRWIHPSLLKIVCKSGSRHVGFMGTTQTANQIHNNILTNCIHRFCFGLDLATDLDWMRNPKTDQAIDHIPFLPNFWYYYFQIGCAPLLGAPVPKMQI